MDDQDYVLGTDDTEVVRLGLQHRVWRPRMLDAWRRAGITEGQSIADLGCGPGYASIDLAHIVGSDGHVTAFERSRRFIAHLEHQCEAQGITNIQAVEADLDVINLPVAAFDGLWCRWVLAFVTAPERLVSQAAKALKSGGVAVFHEYLDYGTWRLSPSHPSLEKFVCTVIESWRETGGEPNIGRALPAMLEREGFAVLATNPIIDVVTPENYVWKWPEAFLRINAERLCALGKISPEDVAEIVTAFDTVKSTPGARMTTPCVIEVIARKR